MKAMIHTSSDEHIRGSLDRYTIICQCWLSDHTKVSFNTSYRTESPCQSKIRMNSNNKSDVVHNLRRR